MFLIAEQHRYHHTIHKHIIQQVSFAPYAFKNKLILFPSSMFYFF